jgi:hypothetical protein
MYEHRNLRTIKELGLTFRPIAHAERRMAVTAAVTVGRTLYVLGRNGTIYSDWGRIIRGEIAPSDAAEDKARVGLIFGLITKAQFDAFAAKCQAAEKRYTDSRAVDDFEEAAEKLGIHISAKIRRKLDAKTKASA